MRSEKYNQGGNTIRGETWERGKIPLSKSIYCTPTPWTYASPKNQSKFQIHQNLSAGGGHSPLSNSSIQIQFGSMPIEKFAKYFPRGDSFAQISNSVQKIKTCTPLPDPFLYLHQFIWSRIHWDISEIHPQTRFFFISHPFPLPYTHLSHFWPPLNYPHTLSPCYLTILAPSMKVACGPP